MDVDLIITNATVVTAADVASGQEIVVSQGRIVAVGQQLAGLFRGRRVLDAQGAYVTPGGVDSHVHLEQDNSPTGDTFETGTRSAVAGGTTTVLSFATQERGMSALAAVEAYHAKARGRAHCDYGFHLIVTQPTQQVLDEELPALAAAGITSVKVYMTYETLKLGDRQMLQLMEATRRLGMTTMVHAENAEMIEWMTAKLEAARLTGPRYHNAAHPEVAEDEATYRAISLARLADVPVLLVHMSSGAAAAHVRRAQTRLLPVYAETCPHYLFFTSERMADEAAAPGFEAAKCVCSPPLRDSRADVEAMWRGLANGTFTTFSSDHAPAKYDHPLGKKAGSDTFTKIPNGLPGVETRLPALFCGGVLAGRISVSRFVELTSSSPAKLYGLDRKGVIAAGYDADLVVWYPTAEQVAAAAGDTAAATTTMEPFELTNEMLHHDIDYTPFEGMRFENWPRYTVLRGSIVWDRQANAVGGDGGDGGDGRFVGRFVERRSSLL